MNTPLFPGQQEGERVLYTVRPHVFAEYVSYVKVGAIALLLLVSFAMLGKVSGALAVGGMLLGLGVFILGAFIVNRMFDGQVAYITDRRVVRFEASNLFAVNSRALSWDDVVKVKTYPPNFLWRAMNVGTVSFHAKTTLVSIDSSNQKNTITNDDLDLHHVFYYRDLGNYVDKLLYTIKHSPEEVKDFRPFVAKPTGQRY
jgi:hypothetical protein